MPLYKFRALELKPTVYSQRYFFLLRCRQHAQTAWLTRSLLRAFEKFVDLKVCQLISIKLFLLVSFVGVSAPAFSHTIEIASVGGDGQLAEEVRRPNMSSDGRYVLFLATGMAPTGGTRIESAQWFLRDRLLKTTELISQSSQGLPAVSNTSFNRGANHD